MEQAGEGGFSHEDLIAAYAKARAARQPSGTN
jgi:hypothetical protein